MQIKKEVENRLNIDDYCQIFFYNNKRLYDNNSFSDYNIKEGAKLELINLNRIEVTLKIQKIPRPIMLYLKGSDEEEDIKNQIFEVYKIPKDLKKFFYQSKPFQFRYFKEII